MTQSWQVLLIQWKTFARIPVDMRTNGGWMALIQGMSKVYHDKEVINFGTKWASAPFFLIYFKRIEI